MATIGTRLAERDRRRFVGRGAELAFLQRCLDGQADASVVLIHGPGGIGKSTLLRELARRAGATGRRAHFVEGRELAPAPRALDAALAGAREDAQPLVLIDTYEQMTALDGYLRGSVVPALPERALVVIAGREAPGRGWLEGGWESVAVQLELSGLSVEEAQELLALQGVHDERQARELVRWAQGSPLALALAGDDALGARGADASSARPDDVERPELVRALIRRLAETEIDGPHLGPLAVAAIARATTIDLLRDVLPDTDAVQGYMWLRARSFTEPLGEGIALHELVRKALRADLRRRDRERERDLRRRIADHLYARARAGQQLLSIDLAHLVENEAIRWGFSWEGAGEHRIDEVRDGDAEEVRRLLGERHVPERWPLAAPYFAAAPERIAIVRDLSDRIRGFELSVTLANAPAVSAEDPLLGPWLEHARRTAPDGDAVLWQVAVDFTADPRARVQAMLGMSGILRSGLQNPRYAYLPIDPRLPQALAFARAAGARRVPELDIELRGHATECHVIDYGADGLLGAQRALIYAELGLTSPQGGAVAAEPAAAAGASAAGTVAAAGPAAPAGAVGVEEVREALRNLGVPHKLADSPLATGSTLEERAASVRAVLESAAARAFGDTPNEQLLRRVLVRGYLDAAASHEQAADELALSRAAYFRRLKAAAERVAALVAEQPPR
ncbi:ATP-binding protein [Conexibacter woesei]|uniref:AAA ATPase n=1 Tax=Conexibacter woesei (strain DSM 14684 / CCUG 47730 / CIP 108061 / JCM 11494 / NBRC 100937 / ID131577) TaxID=469383 RepID=D3FBP8_CONWI|nr:ATP-binding protein [Conexibacter woesei]ADB51313.1 AAA ATPase [Conexibacter woesei DSM 14684]